MGIFFTSFFLVPVAVVVFGSPIIVEDIRIPVNVLMASDSPKISSRVIRFGESSHGLSGVEKAATEQPRNKQARRLGSQIHETSANSPIKSNLILQTHIVFPSTNTTASGKHTTTTTLAVSFYLVMLCSAPGKPASQRVCLSLRLDCPHLVSYQILECSFCNLCAASTPSAASKPQSSLQACPWLCQLLQYLSKLTSQPKNQTHPSS